MTAQANDCGQPATGIHEVQGTVARSPLAGETVTVEGILTRDSRHQGGFDGFYLQQADGETDSNPDTSEALFVYTSHKAGRPGQRLRVTGTIKEYHDLTEMVAVKTIQICGKGEMPTPIDVALPWSQPPESLENMRVRFTAPLTIIDHYQLATYGELTLATNDQITGTERFPPGEQAVAHSQNNKHHRVVLDDGRKVRNPEPVPWPTGGFGPDNTLRAGDQVEQLAGILDYRFGQWRLQAVNGPQFTRPTPRPSAPAPPGEGVIRVMALNLQNYFNGDGKSGGFPTDRGAKTLAGFRAQQQRIASLVKKSQPDILAVSELENDGYGPYSAIADLAASLGPAWRFVKTPGQDGGDAIRTALLYRNDRVAPRQEPERLTTGLFAHSSRPPVSQRFSAPGQGQTLRVVSAHLKSKSCRNASGANQDRHDGQGCFNQRRVQEVRAILQWLKALPDSDHLAGTLVTGDLNSYAREAPVRHFEKAGYRSLVHRIHPCNETRCRHHTYRFRGEKGSLDYLLASENLQKLALTAGSWNVNADEARALTDYPGPGRAGPWRASDHNPVFTDLQLVD